MFVNRHVFRIEWGDCDAAGIVFFPRYFAFFDAATHHLFEAAGWQKRDLRRQFGMIGYPMVDTRAKFIAASTFGDDLTVETRIAAIRRSSFDVEHRAFKPGPDGETLAIEAFDTRVWCGSHPDDPGRLKSQPIPEIVIRKLTDGCPERAAGFQGRKQDEAT